MSKILPLLAAAAGALLVAQPASAESIAVHYNDLDLSTPHGQKELQRRIELAARQVCGVDEVNTATRLPTNQSKKCLEQTRADLKQKIAAAIDRHTAGGSPVHSPAGANPVP